MSHDPKIPLKSIPELTEALRQLARSLEAMTDAKDAPVSYELSERYWIERTKKAEAQNEVYLALLDARRNVAPPPLRRLSDRELCEIIEQNFGMNVDVARYLPCARAILDAASKT